MTKGVLFYEKLRRIAKSRAFVSVRDFITGFLLANCGLASACPFGLSYAAVSGKGIVWRFAGVLSGYFVTGNYGVLYAAATMICLSCHMVLRNIRAYKSRLFMPTVASALLIFCKSAVLFNSFSGVSLLLLICEGVLCFCSSLLFAAAQSKENGLFALSGRVLMLVAAVAAFEPFRILGWFSAARIAVFSVVAVLSGIYGAASGAGFGISLGALLDLCGGGSPGLCLVYGVGGLFCGACRNVPKIVRAGAFCAGCIAVALWSQSIESTAAISAECVFSSAVLLLIPDKAFGQPEGKIGKSSVGTSLCLAVERLGREIVKGRHFSAKSTGSILASAADRVCRNCENLPVCWEKNNAFTANVFVGIENKLSVRKRIDECELPRDFAEKCEKSQKLCDEINALCAENRRRAAMHRKEAETEALMKRQYDGMAALLRELAEPSLLRLRAGSINSARIAEVVRVYYPMCEWDAFFEGDRFIIDIYAGRNAGESDINAIADSLSDALGFELSFSSKISTGKGDALRFCRGECFFAETAVSVRCKEGEAVCGDSVRRFLTDDKRAVVIISDGMGTGKAASEMSSAAADMLAELVLAGASLRYALSATLPVLEARFSRSGFVTLDLLEVDLFSGTAIFIKCGAPPSYIIKNGKREEIFSDSLPAGLDNEPKIFRVSLHAGDTVVMMTDGVSIRGGFSGTPRQICERLTRGEANDDMTAVALKVREA